MIKIPVSLLSAEWMVFEGEEPAELLDVEPTPMLSFSRPVKYRLEAALVSDGILVRGKAETVMNTRCGRCLEDFTAPLTINEVCHFYENVTDPDLDVTADLREDVLIAIPLNPLCDKDCRGLCPTCGVNLNQEKCRCAPPAAENNAWNALDNLKLEK